MFATGSRRGEDNLALNAAHRADANVVHLRDLCAIAVPDGRRPDGTPQGISTVAQALHDSVLASVAAAGTARRGLPLGATGHPLPPSYF